MRQLALGLAPSPVPAFDNFFPGRNVEAVSALQSLATGRSAEHFVYLWGARGCGRSHLLQAAVAAASSRGIIARYVVAGKPLPVEDSGVRMLAVDDVEKLNAQSQLEFFHLYNALRDCQGAVLAAGNVAPARLQLRADLLTRLKRDLPSLMTVLEALDRYSLETKRPITLPLLRELLQSERDGNQNPPPGI